MLLFFIAFPRDFVVNSNDRVIRVFSVKDDGPPEQLHKFQDLVNRIQWNQCCLSSDSDYVIGGSAHQAEHNIYIWDKIGGNLVKILEGPKEPLEDVAVSFFFSRFVFLSASISNFFFFLRTKLVAPNTTHRRFCIELWNDTHLGNKLPRELECICTGLQGTGRKHRL